MPDLGEGSTQPVRMTEDPATLHMQVAILMERVAGLQLIINEREAAMRRALELQAGEYERRLDALNHESRRVTSIQAQSVTADKFEDYIKTQDTALEKALASITEKIESGLTRSDEKFSANTTRIERLENEERSRIKTESRAESREVTRSGAVTQWQLALTGFVVSFVIAAVVIIANILNAKP